MKLLTSTTVRLFEFLKNCGFPFSNDFRMREPLKNFGVPWGKNKKKKNQRIAAPGFLFNKKTLKNRQLS
jgi:hypothetical protein